MILPFIILGHTNCAFTVSVWFKLPPTVVTGGTTKICLYFKRRIFVVPPPPSPRGCDLNYTETVNIYCNVLWLYFVIATVKLRCTIFSRYCLVTYGFCLWTNENTQKLLLHSTLKKRGFFTITLMLKISQQNLLGNLTYS